MGKPERSRSEEPGQPPVPLFAIERLLREVFRASDESEWLTQAELEVEVQRLLSGGRFLTTAAHLADHPFDHPFDDTFDHPAELAQELAFQALESEDPDRALQLADGALKLDARCLDALALRALLSAEDGAELVEQLGRAAAVGETVLGEEFFSEYMGDFWTLVEARPYLRTLRQLAEVLWDQGRRLDAVAQFEELLDLDPADHQGNALSLLACYLCLGEVGRGLDLLDDYYDPDDATWQWGAALAHYLAGRYRRADRQLSLAKTLNPHITAFLCGDRDVPEAFSLRPAPGSEAEAVACAQILAAAWSAHSSALLWLFTTEDDDFEAPAPESSTDPRDPI